MKPSSVKTPRFRLVSALIGVLLLVTTNSNIAQVRSSTQPIGSPKDAGSALPALGDTDRQILSPNAERKLGERIMREIRRDKDYLDDAPLLEYLNDFGTKLVDAHPEARGEADFNYFFFAVRDPVLNAFALPGGFIAAHSGLILAAQTESELAAVIAHEVGHVAQRHIARMLGKQSQDALLPLAGVLLAVLASRSSPDAATAALLGGQGLALQRQLNFSRDAEREADRVGLQILQESNFDTSGMIAFFGRLQAASRSFNDLTPSFLLSHPLTTERIADIQARLGDQRYRQRADGLDFHLIRARTRVLQANSVQSMQEASAILTEQTLQRESPQSVAGHYGLAFIALRQRAVDRAQASLKQARALAKNNMLFQHLAIEVSLAAGQPANAVKEAEAGRLQFPLSRGIALLYADALIAAGRIDDAAQYLRLQAQEYRADAKVHDRLAKAYAAKGKMALQHIALAQAYAANGDTQPALDQLLIARRARDASYYDQSIIDALERTLQALRREELEEEKKTR